MNRAKSLTYGALCCAICAVCAQIALPLGAVPITLQTFAVAFCGFFLGWQRALGAVGAYLAIGALGVPVFSHFQGGLHVLTGPNGGFLIGFLYLCTACGLKKGKLSLLHGAFGVLLCHLAGCVWFATVTNVSVAAAFLSASLPFLAKDLLCVLFAYTLARAIARRL